VAEQQRFNAPAWVGDYILDLAFGAGTGPGRPDSVTLRVPDQPTDGAGASPSRLAR
jgi:hypothetical protein